MPQGVQVQVLSRAPDRNFFRIFHTKCDFLLPGAAQSKGENQFLSGRAPPPAPPERTKRKHKNHNATDSW